MGSLKDELRKTRAKHGVLTPVVLEEDARPTDHPLHHRFEWDDRVGGYQYRLIQARELIREARVSYRDSSGSTKSMREYYPVRAPDSPSPTFEPVDEILQDEIATRILMADMKREWQALKRRYDRFDEFRQMILEDIA